MMIHRATSADGTEIAGRVLGNGPALVLVHGGIGDGEFAWDALLPHLTDRYTCYLPSTRGRGLSADTPDHTPPCLTEDVMAFVASIGEPAYVVGWSGSWAWTLGAAALSPAVAAVAVYEPVVLPAAGPDDLARTGATMEHVGGAAAEGRLIDAMRAFAPWICNEVEIAALEQTDFYERWSVGIPAMLRFIQADATYAGPRPTDPDALARVAAPVLVLQVSRRASASGSRPAHGTSRSTWPTRSLSRCPASAISPRSSPRRPSPTSSSRSSSRSGSRPDGATAFHSGAPAFHSGRRRFIAERQIIATFSACRVAPL